MIVCVSVLLVGQSCLRGLGVANDVVLRWCCQQQTALQVQPKCCLSARVQVWSLGFRVGITASLSVGASNVGVGL